MKIKPLSRARLERLIVDFVKGQSMCVLATCSEGRPRASAVEFFPSGLTLYILTEGGRKVENIGKNPLVSVAIYTPFLGWEKIKGVQVSGSAKIGLTGSRVFKEGVRAYRERLGKKAAVVPDVLKVIKVIPEEIDYLDTTLKSKGLAVRHTLRPAH